MVSGDGSERGDTKKLQSHIVLPSNYIDEVWLGNEKIDKWLSIGNKALPAGDNYTFFLRFDDVVVSIRYLYAMDIDGRQATPRLYIDTDGTQVFTPGNAMRITTDLSTGTPAKWTRGTVAMWWRADDGITTDEQFAALRGKVINAASTVTDDGSRISVQVTSPDGELGFSGNLVRKVFPQARAGQSHLARQQRVLGIRADGDRRRRRSRERPLHGQRRGHCDAHFPEIQPVNPNRR